MYNEAETCNNNPPPIILKNTFVMEEVKYEYSVSVN